MTDRDATDAVERFKESHAALIGQLGSTLLYEHVAHLLDLSADEARLRFQEPRLLSLINRELLALATEAAGEMTDQKDAVSAGYVLGKSVRQHVDALTAAAIERHAHRQKPERDARANDEVWAQIKASPPPPVPRAPKRFLSQLKASRFERVTRLRQMKEHLLGIQKAVLEHADSERGDSEAPA
jgi:hypothetical protein